MAAARLSRWSPCRPRDGIRITDNPAPGSGVIGLLASLILMAVAWAPARLLRAAGRRLLARRGVVQVCLDERVPGVALAGIVAELEALAADPLARAVLLRLGPVPLGWASAQALRAALLKLRAAGRLVAVHLESAGNAGLLVASASDRVWISPGSDVALTGVGAELAFYGDALERLGLRAEMEAAGAYKSAGEPFVRAFPSPENREAMAVLVADLQAQLVDAIAEGRRQPPERVLDWMARAPLSAEEALAEGLVDGLAYEDQIDSGLERLLGAPPRWWSLSRYSRLRRLLRWLETVGVWRPALAVVHLEGAVAQRADGASPAHTIDAERVVPVLEDLGWNQAVRGVVLHIRSPGGAAIPSDEIARAVSRLACQKPVIAVLSDVAASGGYYIAAPAAEIVAAPGTITGSIGVVGGKLVFGEAAARFGVHHERVVAGPNSGIYSPWEPFSSEQRARFRASLGRMYTRFIGVVAAGRRRPAASVEPVAQGRVWTGRQAKELGLVDHLGGLSLGLERAAALAGLPRQGNPVLHLSFPVSRLHFLARTLRQGESTALLELLPPNGAAGIARGLATAPGQPLLVFPWRVDGVSGYESP